MEVGEKDQGAASKTWVEVLRFLGMGEWGDGGWSRRRAREQRELEEQVGGDVGKVRLGVDVELKVVTLGWLKGRRVAAQSVVARAQWQGKLRLRQRRWSRR